MDMVDATFNADLYKFRCYCLKGSCHPFFNIELSFVNESNHPIFLVSMLDLCKVCLYRIQFWTC